MQKIVSQLRARFPVTTWRDKASLFIDGLFVAFVGLWFYAMLASGSNTRGVLLLLVLFWFLPRDAAMIPWENIYLPKKTGLTLQQELNHLCAALWRNANRAVIPLVRYIIRRHVFNRTLIVGMLVILGALHATARDIANTDIAGAVIAFMTLWIVIDQLITGITTSIDFIAHKTDE